MFSLISLRVLALRLAHTHSQQQQCHSQKQPTNPKPHVLLRGESFIPSGKQGGGAAVLGEGRDIVTRETCVPTSLNANNLGKAAVLHFAFAPFCSWGGPVCLPGIFCVCVEAGSRKSLGPLIAT
jgi:hypothetical protein